MFSLPSNYFLLPYIVFQGGFAYFIRRSFHSGRGLRDNQPRGYKPHRNIFYLRRVRDEVWRGGVTNLWKCDNLLYVLYGGGDTQAPIWAVNLAICPFDIHSCRVREYS